MIRAHRHKIENWNATKQGKWFHMNFGFFQGRKNCWTDLERLEWKEAYERTDFQLIITNHESFSRYLLVVGAMYQSILCLFVYNNYIHSIGGEYWLLLYKTVDKILSTLNYLKQEDTPHIISCAKAMSKVKGIIPILISLNIYNPPSA